MLRRSLAGLVLGVSLLLATMAWAGYLAQRTVLDPDRSRVIAEELFDNDEVRSQLASNLASALSSSIPEDLSVPPGTIARATAVVIEDPQFEALIVSAFADTHAAFLGEGDAPQELDLTGVAATARQALVAAAPELAERVPENPELVLDLPTEHIPNADPLRVLLRTLVPVLAIAAAAGAIGALVTTTDRPAVLARAGAWALGSTAFYLAVGLGLPWLLRQYAPDQTEVLSALLAAFLRSVVTPSIVLGVAGLALFGVSFMWPEGGARRGPPRERAPRRDERQAPRRISEPQRVAPTRARPAGGRQAPAPGRAGTTTPGPSPYPPGPSAAAPPRSTAPGGASPYPDLGARMPASAPPPTQPPRSAPSHSVFADVEPSTPVAPVPGRTNPRPPRWSQEHGWVIDPNDPRPVPANARWVEGVGHVIPGPPPR